MHKGEDIGANDATEICSPLPLKVYIRVEFIIQKVYILTRSDGSDF